MTDGTTSGYERELTDGVAPAWLAPSPGLWRMRRAEFGAGTPLVALVLGIVLGIWVSAVAGVVSAVIVVVLGAALAWFAHRRVGAWQYQERHEDLIVARGVMVRRQSVVPYGRMQFVELTAGPFERMFGLSTVKLHTAAAASDARIPGLEHDEAVRLRERLTDLGESHAAGL